MATIKLNGTNSGFVQLVANTAAQNNTLTLPNVNDTLANITSPTFYSTNSGVAMVIDANGNMGIGTSIPAYLLDVNGSARIGGSTSNSNQNFYINAGIQSQTTANWNFSNVNFIRNSSNTQNPRFIGMLLDGDSINSTTIGAYNAIWGSYNANPTTGSTSASLQGAMVYGAYYGHRWVLNGTEAMRITSSGQVGINTTNPSTILQVVTSTQGVDGITIIGPNTSNQNGIMTIRPNNGQGNNNGITQAGDSGIIYSSNAGIGTGNLVIAPWFSGTSGIRMNGSGNVGIATTNATAALHVFGNATGTGQASPGAIISRFMDGLGRNSVTINGGIDGNTPATNATLNIGGGAALTWSLSTTHGVNLATTFAGSGSTGLVVQGYVGINDTSPGANLTVGNGTGSTSLFVYGNVTGSKNSYVRLTDTSGTSIGLAVVVGGVTTVNIEGGSGISYLNGGGSVGIGTNSSAARLTVRGDTGDNATIDIKNNTTNIWKLWNDNGASALNFQYNGTTTVKFNSSGTANATQYTTVQTTGGSTMYVNQQQTTSVSTSATTILATPNYATLALVHGSDGTNRFSDLVLMSVGTGTLNVISSLNAGGSPAARTYTQASSTFKLAMASGTYTVQVSAICMNS